MCVWLEKVVGGWWWVVYFVRDRTGILSHLQRRLWIKKIFVKESIQTGCGWFQTLDMHSHQFGSSDSRIANHTDLIIRNRDDAEELVVERHIK